MEKHLFRHSPHLAAWRSAGPLAAQQSVPESNDQERGTKVPADNGKRKPYRVRLSGFVNEKDIGLGDLIKRATYAVGVNPCGGCARRAAALNRWMVFSGKR